MLPLLAVRNHLTALVRLVLDKFRHLHDVLALGSAPVSVKRDLVSVSKETYNQCQKRPSTMSVALCDKTDSLQATRDRDKGAAGLRPRELLSLLLAWSVHGRHPLGHLAARLPRHNAHPGEDQHQTQRICTPPHKSVLLPGPALRPSPRPRGSVTVACDVMHARKGLGLPLNRECYAAW